MWGEKMVSLASINTQLANAEAQIAEVKLKLEEKEEELRRTKEAQGDVISNKNDFLGEEEICLEPEFSMKTCHGQNADDFDDFRGNVLKESFREIPVTQIMDAIAKMQEKINELIEEIEALEAEIASLEARRLSLLASRSALSVSGGRK